jgi:hypothetical protein
VRRIAQECRGNRTCRKMCWCSLCSWCCCSVCSLYHLLVLLLLLQQLLMLLCDTSPLPAIRTQPNMADPSSITVAAAFALHSRPSATKKIYLDFDGTRTHHMAHVMPGPATYCYTSSYEGQRARAHVSHLPL